MLCSFTFVLAFCLFHLFIFVPLRLIIAYTSFVPHSRFIEIAGAQDASGSGGVWHQVN